MKRLSSAILLCLLLMAGLLSPGMAGAEAAGTAQDQPTGPGIQPHGGKIVVANRASGTISVIDVASDQVIATPALPAGDNPPEPMYVVYTLAGNRVFVGDRANDRVVIFDAGTFEVKGTVPTGSGVFHMWADPENKQLWVNNDIDNTATVINPRTLDVVATVSMPADLVAQGGKPHDVVLDVQSAYVTMIGVAGDADYVVKFSRRTFQEEGRAAVGKDAHVSLTLRNQLLYVPGQNSNVVTVLDRRTLAQVTAIAIPGAHGAGMAWDGKTFYTTNLPGGGNPGLFAIDTRTNTVIGTGVDTPYPVPHNIALTLPGDKLYVTHSGATADKVTIYTTTRQDRIPVLAGEVTVGLNPFGIALVP